MAASEVNSLPPRLRLCGRWRGCGCSRSGPGNAGSVTAVQVAKPCVNSVFVTQNCLATYPMYSAIADTHPPIVPTHEPWALTEHICFDVRPLGKTCSGGTLHCVWEAAVLDFVIAHQRGRHLFIDTQSPLAGMPVLQTGMLLSLSTE